MIRLLACSARLLTGSILAAALLAGGAVAATRPPQEAAASDETERAPALAGALAACEVELAGLVGRQAASGDELRGSLAELQEALRSARAELRAVVEERNRLVAKVAAVNEPSVTAEAAAASESAPLSEPLEPLLHRSPVVAAGSGADDEGAERAPAEPAVPLEPLAADVTPDPPDTAALVAVVEAWARDWSAQRVDEYLDHYAPDFRPRDGSSRSEWEVQRRLRVAEPGFIEVSISAPRVEIETPDRAAVRFNQIYRSDSYLDRVDKVLVLARGDGGWKIVDERAE